MGDNALGCTMIKEDVTIAQDHFHKQEYFVKCVDWQIVPSEWVERF